MIYLSICSILGHDSKEVEYLDLVLEGDRQMFVDPILIEVLAKEESNRGYINELSSKAYAQIKNFFDNLLVIYRECKTDSEKKEKLKQLFEFRNGEIKELKLGYSANSNYSKGNTQKKMVDIFMRSDVQQIIQTKSSVSPVYKTPLIKSFADDRLSDLVSNIISNIIIEFNEYLKEKYPEMTTYVSTIKKEYKYFSNGEWSIKEFTPFIFENEHVLFVPEKFSIKHQTVRLERLIDVYIEEPISKMPIPEGSKKKTAITKKEYKKRNMSGKRIEKANELFKNTSLAYDTKYEKKLQNKAREYIRDL